jgi:hypothetical protein
VNLAGAYLAGADLRSADLTSADLAGANLTSANLAGANLTSAYLARANLDFSCWPLWCGSLKAKIDIKIAAQLAYHLLAVWPEARTDGMVKLANTFHRVKSGECQKIEAAKKTTKAKK